MLRKIYREVTIESNDCIDKPKILVAREKHGDRYFEVKDYKQLDRICLKLLEERLSLGYYNPGKPIDKPIKENYICNNASVETKLWLEKKFNEDLHDYNLYRLDVEDYQKIKMCLESQNNILNTKAKPTSFQLLKSRFAGYESVELIELEIV